MTRLSPLKHQIFTINMGQKLPATTINLITAYFRDNRPVEKITNIIKALSTTVYRMRLSFNLFGTLYSPKSVRQG